MILSAFNISLSLFFVDSEYNMGNHIHLACWRGDWEALDKYMGPMVFSNPLNFLGVFGVRPLHIAVFRNHKHLVDRMIMSMNYEDFHATFGAEGVTAVHLAEMMGYGDMASFLTQVCECLLFVRHRLRLVENQTVEPNNYVHHTIATYQVFKGPQIGFTKALEIARKVNRDVNCAVHGCPPHFTPIFLAVLLDNIKALKLLIKEGGKPHLHPVIAEGDYHLLHLAARFDHYKIIPILVKAGCSLYEKTKTNRTPLAIAAHWGHLRSIKALADSPDFNIKSAGGNWALYAAAQQGQFHVIRTLIKLGCSVDSFFQDDSPLHVAAAYNHTAVVRVLLDCGANPLATSTTSEGKTPLIAAAAYGSCDVVQPLMEAIKNSDDLRSCFTPAELAIYYNHFNFLITLIKCGFDINLVDEDGYNLLHSCIIHGLCSRKTLSHLMELGCDVTTTNVDGLAPIHLAVKLNESNAIRALVDGGCSVNLRSNKIGSPTAVHLAAASNHIACIEMLHALKCDLEVQLINSSGLRPLQVAVLKKNREACRKLVELGADIHGHSAAGLAPLHYAALKDEVDMIEELIKCGSDPDVQWRETMLLLLTLASRSRSVYTPLHVAVSARNVKAVKKLLELGSTVDCSSETPSTFTALHMASERGYVEIVSALIANGADIEKTTDSLCTPLSLAVESNHPEAARVLLLNGCDVDHISFFAGETDLTPFQLACLLCHPDVVQVLIPYIKDIDKLSPDGLSPLHLTLLKPYYWEPTTDDKYVPFFDPNNIEQYETNQRKLIRILLDNGCNVNATDEKGVTALDLAANYDLESIVMMLVKAGGERGETIKDGDKRKEHIEELENHAAMALRGMKKEIKDLQELQTQATEQMEALHKDKRQMHKLIEEMQAKLQRLGPQKRSSGVCVHVCAYMCACVLAYVPVRVQVYMYF